MMFVSFELIKILFAWIVIINIGIVTWFLIFCKWRNEIFKRRGVPCAKPVLLFGNMGPIILQKESMMDLLLRIYKEHPNDSVVGYMQLTAPFFMIRDLKLIKEITVKQFDCFNSHLIDYGRNTDPIFGFSLFTLTGSVWKAKRGFYSPAFTGSRVKHLLGFMDICAQRTVDSLTVRTNNSKTIQLDFRDFFLRYSADTFALSVFGLEVNSVTDPDNQFYQIAKAFTTLKPSLTIKLFILIAAPWLFRLLKLSILDESTSLYFMKTVKEAIEYRIAHNIVQSDILNVFIEEKLKGKKKGSAEYDSECKDFIIQCLVFLFASLELTSKLFRCLAYELAVNEEVQSKVLAEVNAVKEKYQNEPNFNFEMSQELKYMEMVINETIRYWTLSANLLDRRCTKDTILYDSYGKAHQFKKGDFITLPAIGIHHDSQYYENSDQFVPERFASENKEKFDPFTFLSFGAGPRMCIGTRFVLLECKCIFYTLLSKYKLSISSDAKNSISFGKGTLAYMPAEQFKFNLTKIN